MKIFNRLVLVLAVAFVGSSASAQTPGCTSSHEAATKMWDAWHNAIIDGTETVEKYALPTVVDWFEYQELASTAVTGWNQLANNSWSTIGPRSLNIGSTETGNVVGRTTRTFIMPPSNRDTIRVTINKTDGRARTGVTICTQTNDDRRQSVVSHSFPNTNDPLVETFEITGAADKVISIAIKNYSVGNQFQYSIIARAPSSGQKKRRGLGRGQ